MSIKQLKEIHLSNYEKIGVVWGLLVILIVVGLGIRLFQSQFSPSSPKGSKTVVSVTSIPTQEKLIGRMTFNNVPKKVKERESFSLTVDFTAPDKRLDGADAAVSYDPNFLEVEEITQGPYFHEYPRKTIDHENGKVKVTAFRAKDESPIRNSVTLFYLKVKALKAGETVLSFDYQEGRTNLSNVVEKGTSKNILGSVENARIVIE